MELWRAARLEARPAHPDTHGNAPVGYGTRGNPSGALGARRITATAEGEGAQSPLALLILCNGYVSLKAPPRERPRPMGC